MTSVNITPGLDSVKIQLIGVGQDKAALLETFDACAGGSCECSTDEYVKVASMNVNSDGDDITIDVQTKTGQTIDPSCITDCLDHAVKQAQ